MKEGKLTLMNVYVCVCASECMCFGMRKVMCLCVSFAMKQMDGWFEARIPENLFLEF